MGLGSVGCEKVVGSSAWPCACAALLSKESWCEYTCISRGRGARCVLVQAAADQQCCLEQRPGAPRPLVLALEHGRGGEPCRDKIDARPPARATVGWIDRTPCRQHGRQRNYFQNQGH